MLIHEAEETGAIERCARSLLVRELHKHLPEGWHAEWVDDGPASSGFRRAGVYADWGAALPARYEEACDRVWDALVSSPIPEGWLPDGPDDPFLSEAFRHWEAPG